MNNIMKKFSPMTPRRDENQVAPLGEESGPGSSSGIKAEKERNSGGKKPAESSPVGEDGDESKDPAKFHQERALTLMHMRKLFGEFCKSHLSSAEYEQKIYRMLPLLSKVMCMYSPDEVPSQFKEIAQFTGHITKLFVQEVRKRASNQSTEAAAIAIAQFLEPPLEESSRSADTASKGWLLMSGLDFLTRTGILSVIEAACRAALPSTLSKALYLFYDLPPVPETDLILIEKREKLQETFVELLTKLCSHSCAGEELARKDDLSLLFSGASSWCPVHNVSWRKVTSQLLMTISSRILTQTVIKYVHSKACISQFLDNLREFGKEDTLTVPERAEMIVCLFCILKDSSNVTPTFLDDLKDANGYQFLTRFILDHESEDKVETQDALRNLLLMFSSVVAAGHTEIRPNQSSSLYTLPGFSLPQPLGEGCSVRNVQAFHVLEQVFLKSRSSSICCTVLDVINSIYSADPANYFILEQQCTLGQFAEKIHTKDKSVQTKFFELLEYVVFHLNYIPAKEFISLCILLKTQSSAECSILCIQSLFRILSYNAVLKNVFRDVGLLEILVSLMQQYAERVKSGIALSRSDQTIAFLVFDMLTVLLKNNNSNAGVFRECGGTGCIHGLLTVDGPKEWRPGMLQLVQQLLMLPAGDEDLTGLLALLHSTPPHHLDFKTALLKALLCVLRESHRVRLAFRRVGGYIYLMSVLLSMEGSLSDPPSTAWDTWSRPDRNGFCLKVLHLFQLIFKVITISMRFEPANARFFHSEVRYSSLVDSLLLSGAFRCGRKVFSSEHEREIPEMDQDECKDYARKCHRIFELQLEERILPEDVPPKMVFVCYVLRLLYCMALDNYEKSSPSTSQSVNGNHNQTLFPNTSDSIVVHPGAVLCILDLLPAIQCEDLKWELSVQLYGAEIVKSLVRSERNQQVMCEAGLPRRLFSVASDLFRGEDHVLLYSFYYILERLSAQGMQSKELREFLRLDMPLCCRSLDDKKSSPSSEKEKTCSSEGGPVPLTRVKALVSMMTPRDFRIAGVSTSPPFVEFDMSVEGFGCVFLPSIGPIALTHASSSVASGNLDSSQKVSGGVGTGERIFPPLTGLTFMSWIYVDRFSDSRADSHPIRLLTVSRTVPQKGSDSARGRRHSSLIEFIGGDSGGPGTPGTPGQCDFVEMSCLSIQVSPLDRSLIVATHESDTPGADLERDTGPQDCFARLSVPELTEEKQWCHLAVVLNRAVLKQSSLTVYINGRLYCTQKLHYVIQNPGGGAATLAQAVGVHATVGTPPGPMRKQSKLQWRLGPTYLLEEAMNADAVTLACGLGPLYTGSFQSPVLPNGERLPPLIPEERVSFGIHAQATSQMTLSRLRKVYNKTDCRAIAKYLGISTHENATPIRILHNSAGHLNGPARSLGGVLIGYLGMRTFCPQPVGKLLESVGGLSCLLGLVAMANDTEGLYASLKALLCAIRNNRNIANDMNSTRGYQTLAVLLKEKSRLLNSHILHLVFSLSGTLDSARETTVIPNQQAFEDLLCDLDVWRQAPAELQRLLYEHFYELITESGEHKQNLKTIRMTGLLARLLFRLNRDPSLLRSTKDVLFNLFAAILQPLPDNASLLKFGQFVASTTPTSGPTDGEKDCPFDVLDIQTQLFSGLDESLDSVLYNVYVRNRCLNILLNMLLHTSGNLNSQLCDQVVRVLAFDWVFAFLSPRSHPATVWTALRILLALLNHPPLLQKFKEGSGSGGWLSEAESVVQNRAGVVLGFSVSAHGGAVGSACDINPEICHCPGFLALQHLLPYHAGSADCYLAMLSLLVGQPTKDLHHVDQFTLDSIWSLVFGIPPSHSVAEAIGKVELCPDAVTPILAMVGRCLQQNVNQASNVWARSYPQAVLQFLTFLYHNVPDFTTYCATEEFLTSLMGTLFRDKYLPLDFEEKADEREKERLTSVDSQDEHEFFDHPARKAVIEFLKSILVDSFHCVASSKGECVVDILLELMPENSSKKEQISFVTSLLNSTMEHLLASDVLLCGQSASLPLTAASSGNNYSMMAANVFYFTSRLMDCVWNGQYSGEPQVVFEFLLKLLGQAKRKTGSGVPHDPLMFSLNRSVLYMLSRPVDSIQVQLTVLESLHKVVGARNVVFSTSNNDPEFLGCLSHLLFMLSVTPAFMASASEQEENISPEKKTEEKRLREGSALVATAAHRVWEEMYIVKKQILEEKFKTSLVPEINAARALIGEAANKCWQNFVDGEMRGPSRDLGQIQQQLQSKIQKVASGLQRLASKKALATRVGVSTISNALTSSGSAVTPGYSATNKTVVMPSQTLHLWMRVHVSLIKELVNLQATQYRQWHEHVEKWCLNQWHSVEQELTRERGLWGPYRGSLLDKWMLDSTEGPCRMRKKLIPNPSFYLHYPYRPNLELPEHRSLKCKVALSRNSRDFYDRMKQHRPRTMDMRILDSSTTVMTPSEEKTFIFRDMREINASMIRRVSLASTRVAVHDDSEETDDNPSSCAADDNEENSEKTQEDKTSDTISIDSAGGKDLASNSGEKQKQLEGVEHKRSNTDSVKNQLQSSKGPDNQTLLRLLEEGEELQSMFRCARIEGLDTSEGLLLFGKDHYYVVDGYTLLKTREIRDLDFLPENLHDPIIPYTATGSVRPRGQKRHCSKFSYEDVREVLKRRYLLQPIALEVFSADGRNYLLAFPKKTRNKVYTKFLSVAKSMTDSWTQSISGQRSSMSLEQSGSSSLFSSLVGETSVTQRWVRGEISNFQYLIHLNTLAGRSYNDLSQYPVFPWVLADYDSEELDLTDPNSFRDFNKSMGAQTPDRLEQFLKRYREWDDPTGEIPPYMYGTHYSSAMIVVSYLVRLEPFTQQFLKLQGGHFDLADRMFHSIKDGWFSASKNNMADVKELIPEFFYLPDFLVNANKFDLGVKQSGVPLDDVLLPSWAKGDAREFVRIHREALESDYVSSHLHEWIDLIFGYKQQGQSAIDAQNLFHHLFYEGNVDIEAIEDPLTRNATIGFINNFGQIPSQLFKKPHPAKKLPPNSVIAKSAASGLTSLPDPSLSTPGVTTERFFFHCLDCLKPPIQPVKELRGAVGQIFCNERGQLCAVEQNKVLLPPLFSRYLAWGFADRSIRLGNYDTDRSVCIHELAECGDIVCAVCPNSRVVVTGSTNTVVTVWELVGASNRISSTNCVLKVRKALYGHTEPVSCVAASGGFGIVVSGSRDASCIVWDLSKYSFIRQLAPHPGPVSAVAINEVTGDIASSAGTYLYLWSINGERLAFVNTAASPKVDTKQLIYALAFSTINEWDSQHVVLTGSSDGIVKMWSLDYVQLLPEVEVGEPPPPPTDTSLNQLSKVETPQSAPPMLGSQGFRGSFSAELLNQRLLLQQQSSFGSSLDTPLDTPKVWSLSGSPEFNSPLPPDSGFATPLCHRSFSYNEVNGAGGNLARQGSSDSFVFVNREGVAMVKTSNKLKPGFRWNRQLIIRSKLTLHTANERKDNPQPAAISAIAPSKDHKTLYVGDSRGRIWAWIVGEASPGGRADHWAQDFSRSSCVQCHQRFSLAERKHHCRNCGQIFCARCSRFESEIRHMKITKPVRVCQNCFVRLRAESNETKRD